MASWHPVHWPLVRHSRLGKLGVDVKQLKEKFTAFRIVPLPSRFILVHDTDHRVSWYEQLEDGNCNCLTEPA